MTQGMGGFLSPRPSGGGSGGGGTPMEVADEPTRLRQLALLNPSEPALTAEVLQQHGGGWWWCC
jgi:hypothetical protein